MDDRRPSRISRLEKRRKNSKMMAILVVIGLMLFTIFLWKVIFNSSDDNESTADAPTDVTEKDDDTVEREELDKDDTDNKESDSGQEQEDKRQDGEQEENKLENEDRDLDIDYSQDSVITEEVAPSDDNVIEAVEGNWRPIQTEQDEPEILNFDSDSLNRHEMELAIKSAIDIADPIIWWLANAGNQQVIGTVSDRQEQMIYRVYIRWQDGIGWQPFKVERLKENDQKWRFES